MDGRTNVMKLLVAFRNFDSATKSMKRANLTQNIIILLYSFFFKNTFFHQSHAGFIETIGDKIYFSKKNETKNLISYLVFINIPKNCTTTSKKGAVLTKGLMIVINYMYE
jgi:hypothetical protein